MRALSGGLGGAATRKFVVLLHPRSPGRVGRSGNRDATARGRPLRLSGRGLNYVIDEYLPKTLANTKAFLP